MNTDKLKDKLSVKVIMLPTYDSTQITKSITSDKLFYSKEIALAQRHVESEGAKFQHLYFVVSERIDKNDYYIDDSSLIRQSVISNKEYWTSRNFYKKIIASTNQSLGLPLIPQSFIEEYVTKQGGIYEEILETTISLFKGNGTYGTVIAKTTENNEVIIVSDNTQYIFTKQDLEDAFEAGKESEKESVQGNIEDGIIGRDGTYFHEWFDKKHL